MVHYTTLFASTVYSKVFKEREKKKKIKGREGVKHITGMTNSAKSAHNAKFSQKFD